MFFGCTGLSSLNSSNFDTSNVINMGYMFCGCKHLSSLNLFNFDTPKVTNMESMFSYCSSLSSLNLSNFDTSKVTNMDSMFYSCSNLSSLNLSNFDTSNVTNMKKMFNYCSKLEYINLKNFIENNSLIVSDIFKNIPNNLVVCLNENSNKIKQEIMNKKCYSINCSDNWEINKKKSISEQNICYDNSDNSISYKYEYQEFYYEYCINGNVTNNKTINYCKCYNEKCHSCSDIPIKDLKDDLYEIENDAISNRYKKCYKDPTGYYLDMDESIYKKCYQSCQKCEIKGNNITHNCIECNNDFPMEFKVNNYSNCYQNCSYYYYFDINNNYQCTNDSECPKKYPILDRRECKMSNKIQNRLEDLINNKTTKATKED